MIDIIGHRFILDGEVKPISQWNDQIFSSSSIVYEVVRVEEGTPLFFDDYYERLKSSFYLTNKPLNFSNRYLRRMINKLFELNGLMNGSVKLLFQYIEPVHFIAHLMVPHVPKLEAYVNGVHTILLHKERLNPNAKVWNHQTRNRTIAELNKNKAYEGLLVNEEGFITEGSRSNIFFVKDGVVYTTPDDSILPGITRKKVLQICDSNGIEVKMRRIYSDKISIFDSVFLTGTTRKVLPVKTIETIKFSVENKTMTKIITEFEKLVAAYINEAKKNT